MNSALAGKIFSAENAFCRIIMTFLRIKSIFINLNENKIFTCFLLSAPHDFCYQLFGIYIFVIADSNCKLVYEFLNQNLTVFLA